MLNKIIHFSLNNRFFVFRKDITIIKKRLQLC